tara:strand:- start:2000 stop:2227 length:228 start_codon:yes stop_codon:yes gene_type:complete
MGEHETLKNGTLVVYTNIDDEDVFGVIMEFVEKHEKYLSPAIKVHWFDDDQPTYETVTAILDPEEDYIRVVSYAV